jgi:hypothetical protein
MLHSVAFITTVGIYFILPQHSTADGVDVQDVMFHHRCAIFTEAFAEDAITE